MKFSEFITESNLNVGISLQRLIEKKKGFTAGDYLILAKCVIELQRTCFISHDVIFDSSLVVPKSLTDYLKSLPAESIVTLATRILNDMSYRVICSNFTDYYQLIQKYVQSEAAE